MDTNFREFFYSGSVHQSEIRLFRSRSLDPEFSIPFTTPNGLDKYIQIRSGSDLSGSGAVFTGSQNFTFDYDNNIFEVTGSTNIKGNVEIDGVITAHTYITTTVSSSVLFDSGSTQFGDSLDDTHIFSGGLYIAGNIDSVNAVVATSLTGSLLSTNGVLSSSAQIASEISGAFTPASSSFSTRVTTLESFSASLDDTFTTDAELNSATASLSSSLSTDIALNLATGSDHETRIINLENTSYFSGSAQVLSGSGVFSSSAQLPSGIISSSTQLPGGIISSSTQLPDGLVSGSPQVVTLLSGQDISVNSISASIYHEIYTTQSINLGSGSFQFGDSIDDTHVFTGSVFMTGSLTVTGIISASDDIIAFASSDERLKDNVALIANALDKVNLIGGYEFDWNSNSNHSGHDVGVIAQEIEKVLPEVVTQRDNGYLAVRYEKIVALLIQAVKEQQLQIDELKSKL
jgi:hypothetical protein